MRRSVVLVASAAINASAIPSLAAECTSSKGIDADLIFGNRKLRGALTGDPATGDAALRFSVLSGASAMIETVPLRQAAAAYAKMMSGKARFRMVLTMEP